LEQWIKRDAPVLLRYFCTAVACRTYLTSFNDGLHRLALADRRAMRDTGSVLQEVARGTCRIHVREHLFRSVTVSRSLVVVVSAQHKVGPLTCTCTVRYEGPGVFIIYYSKRNYVRVRGGVS
jgi:hypothetical protein